MTIRKAAAVVKFRAGDDGRGFRLGAPVSVLAMHQLSRWVVAKEDHCGRTTTLVATWPSYSCQRMMPEAFAISRRIYYEDALTIHHAVLSAAMKATQSVGVWPPAPR